MALTPIQQQTLIEAQGDLTAYLSRNPHMQPYQDKLDIKFEAAYRPEQILKEETKSLKKTKKK